MESGEKAERLSPAKQGGTGPQTLQTPEKSGQKRTGCDTPRGVRGVGLLPGSNRASRRTSTRPRPLHLLAGPPGGLGTGSAAARESPSASAPRGGPYLDAPDRSPYTHRTERAHRTPTRSPNGGREQRVSLVDRRAIGTPSRPVRDQETPRRPDGGRDPRENPTPDRIRSPSPLGTRNRPTPSRESDRLSLYRIPLGIH